MKRFSLLGLLCLLAATVSAREVTWEGVLLNQTDWSGDFPTGAPFSLTIEFDTAPFSGTVTDPIGTVTLLVSGETVVSGEAWSGGRISFNIAAHLNKPSISFNCDVDPEPPEERVGITVNLYRDFGDDPVDFSLEQALDLSAFRLIEVIVEKRSPADSRLIDAGFGWVTDQPLEPGGPPDPVKPDGYRAIFGFGDSLSESSLVFTPGENGTFLSEEATNGPVWLQYLAWMLDIPFRSDLNFSQFGGFDLPEQEFFVPLPREASLATSWVNSELLNGILTIAFSDGSEEAQASADAIAILNERLFLKRAELVHALDIPDYLVLGVADIGFAPGVALFLPLSEQKERLSQFVDATNAVRLNIIENWFSTLFPGMRVTFYNPNGHLREIQADPASFGFTNMTNAATGDESGTPALEDLSITGPGSTYFFWEDLSPTTKVHRILAQRVHERAFPGEISPVTPPILKIVRFTESQVWLFVQHAPEGSSLQLLEAGSPDLSGAQILHDVQDNQDPSLFFIAPVSEEANHFFGLGRP